MTLLSVCHTVVPERNGENGDKIIYQGASPGKVIVVKSIISVCVYISTCSEIVTSWSICKHFSLILFNDHFHDSAS